MKNPQVALQMWSVREDQKADFAATVAAVAKIGYAGVELAGYGNLDAKGAKAALDAAGLKVAGMHVGAPRLRTDIEGIISEALLFGTHHVTCSSWPSSHYATARSCEHVGLQLDAFGAHFNAHGIRFGFHNHAHEATLVDGRPVFDWMLGAAAPRHLAAQPDVYWFHAAGYPAAKFLRDHGARCPLIHLKDKTELGLGPVDFDSVFKAVDDVGAAEWLIVEQEEYNHAPIESVRLCFEQLRRWGRV